MTKPLTVSQFMKQLDKLVPRVAAGAVIRINGEPVTELSLTYHHPLAEERRSDSELAQLVEDKMRDQVFDISTNGRESPSLPMVRRDMRSW